MSAPVRRRRALVLLSLALACGGLAASQVRERVAEVEGRVGSPVPVLVAARDLPPDSSLGRGTLAVRRVPERFVPPDALAPGEAAQGLRTAGGVAAGSYLTAGLLRGRQTGGAGGRGLRRGERAVEVSVAGGEALSEGAAPGTRVDLLVSTERTGGSGRTFLALENVELLSLRPGGGPPAGGEEAESGAAANATAVATLRVTLRQAIYLTAAQNFARELRLLVRPPGDRGRLGRTAIEAGAL